MARYFLNIGTDWSSTANWSDTSGGAGGFSVPTNTDDVFFDANSGNCILTATVSDCKSFNTTGFTGTFDINSRLFRMQGSLTVSATTVITRTTGLFLMQGSSSPLTITTNGVNFPYLGLQGSSITYNLLDDINAGVFTISNPCNINGNNIYVSGTFINNAFSNGTTVITANGATTITSTLPLGLPFVVNSASAITFSGLCAFRNLTYTTAASVTTTGSTLSSGNNNCSWNTNGIIWDNVLIGAGTITLGSDLRYTGTLTAATANTVTFNGAYNVYLGAVLTTGGGGSGLGGTATLVCDGTTTWSTTGGAGIRMNFNVTATGNLTISGNVYYSTGTLTVDPAATVTTTGSTLNITGSCTLDTSSVSWNNVTETSATTITNTSVMYVHGTFTHANGSSTWNGSDIYLYGSITLVNGNIGNGTATFIYKGLSGIWSATNGLMQADFTIDALSSLIISGPVRYNLGYLYFDPLSSIVSTGSVLTLGTSTISTNGVVLDSILVNATSSLTINSKLLSTTLTISNTAVTFTGLFGFKVTNYILTTPTGNRAVSYKNGITYEVDNLFESNGTSTNKYTFTSDSATVKAIFILAYGATQSVKNTSATRIDSSGGQTINASLASVLTDTINWQLTEGNWWLVLNRA